MSWWRRIFRPEDEKLDLDAEIAAHLALAAADKRDRGMTEDAARREAAREFGNAALVKDVVNHVSGWVWLQSVQRDLQSALLQWFRAPRFCAAVTVTLALGIAAAAAMFAVVDQVLLSPLPYPHPAQLVTMDETSLHGKPDLDRGVAYLDLQAWQQQNQTLQQIAYYQVDGRGNFLEGSDGALEMSSGRVSPNFFATLGVRARLGRGFQEDTKPFADGKNANTIVLNDAVWREMFGGNPTIVGKDVLLNGQAYAVIGVMPPGFVFDGPANRLQVWTTLKLDEDDKSRANRPKAYEAIGRLKDGVSLASAQADLNRLQGQIAKTYLDPKVREARAQVKLQPYEDSLVEADLKRGLLALMAASGVLWLIACVNVANLFLVRATARQREMAVRSALGASRSRIMQRLVAEGLVLSGAASLLGCVLAAGAITLFEKHIPTHLRIAVPARANLTMLLVLVGLTLLSTVFSSLWPAFLSAHMPIEPALKQGSQQSGTHRSYQRLRSALVISEIAMSLTLLAGCGLLLRTIYSLRHVPLGFRTDRIVVANLTIPAYRFAHRDMTTELYQPLLDRVQHMPGVEAATLITEVPLGQTFHMQLTLTSQDSGLRANGDNVITSNFRGVTYEAQQVFGFKMLSGRYFNRSDTATSQPVALVNRRFAQLYARNPLDPRSVLGVHLLNIRKNQPTEVVGVLDDARQSSITQSEPEVEICFSQMTPDGNSYLAVEGKAMDLALRTARPFASIAPELKSLLRQASPELANATLTNMDEVVADTYGNQSLAAHLLEIFGGTALLLCITGLYGLLAYVVAQRTREIGVRLALGAQRRQVLWLVLRQAGALVIAGVAIGLSLAIACGRWVHSFLYGVADHDVWTMISVALLVLLSGGLAAYLPARRAARVHPMDALRAE